MSAMPRSSVIVFGVLIGIFVGSFASAQPPGYPLGPHEVYGVVKSVDAASGTLTITANDDGRLLVDKEFPLAQDAEIALGNGTLRRTMMRPGKLSDLIAGSLVTLRLDDDDRMVTSVLAQGPLVRGAITKVDVGRQQLTVALSPPIPPPLREQSAEGQTFRLAADAEIGIDDGRGRSFSIKEGKLADLKAEAQVALQLSPNLKEVQSLLAQGPIITGVVKSATADDKLTVILNPQRERTLDLAADAEVWLDDGKGRRLSLTAAKLADVPAGAVVQARLSGDQQLAVRITAEGPRQPGLLKSVDPDKRTITVTLIPSDRRAEPKSFAVADDARIVIDGAPVTLGELQPAENGPPVYLRLSLDQKTVHAISINTGR